MKETAQDLNSLRVAIDDNSNVSGLTHDFYNYPARFSPLFAREAIKAFTKPGDFVLDPFMGGGTTLVEAQSLGRHSIGLDISGLAHFVTKVKTTPLTRSEIQSICNFKQDVLVAINIQKEANRPLTWIEEGYQRNLSIKTTWRIRKTIEQILAFIEAADLSTNASNFTRCALLKVGQWALDNSKVTPSVSQFREKLDTIIDRMILGIEELKFPNSTNQRSIQCRSFNNSSVNIANYKSIKNLGSPSLILTSPPYPGVHVLYHRWQIHGRKETPAPFWIANRQDGQGIAHYTMGSRFQDQLIDYFNMTKQIFSELRKISDASTLIAQVIAFSKPEWQLPKYADTLNQAGFKEIFPFGKRIWRNVPNRKWYTYDNNRSSSANEAVLFHSIK